LVIAVKKSLCDLFDREKSPKVFVLEADAFQRWQDSIIFAETNFYKRFFKIADQLAIILTSQYVAISSLLMVSPRQAGAKKRGD
jgi:hypothetical protein